MTLCDGGDEAAGRAVVGDASSSRGELDGRRVLDDRRGVEQDLGEDAPQVVDVVVEDVRRRRASSATPVVKIASSSISTIISTGSHGSTMLPAISIATVSTTSSIISVTNWATITENTRCSCGNCTFLIRPAPPCTRADRRADRDREEVERQQAAQEVEREVLQAARVADRRRLALKTYRKMTREDHHLRQRVEQAPRPAEDRLLVAGPQLLQRQQVQQVAVRSRRSKSHAGESVPTGRHQLGA